MNDLDDLAGLDDVLGPLRGAATTAELANEASTVERMVAAHRSTTGWFAATPRRAKVAALVAAGVLGFGGMAAASPGMLGTPEPLPVVTEIDEPIIEDPPIGESPADDGPVDLPPVDVPPVDDGPVDVPPVVEGPVIDPPVSGAPEIEVPVIEMPGVAVPGFAVPGVDDQTTSFDESTCLPGNHGATVSAVARGEFPDGVSVIDAARSTCGPSPQPDASQAPAGSAGPPAPRHEPTPRPDRGAPAHDRTPKDHPGTPEHDRTSKDHPGKPEHDRRQETGPGDPAGYSSIGTRSSAHAARNGSITRHDSTASSSRTE